MNCRLLSTILFLTLLSSFTGYAQMLYPISDAQMAQLRGPVKSVTTYALSKKTFFTEAEIKDYQAKGEKPPKYQRGLLSIDYYNQDGFYTESIDTVINYRQVYMYYKPESGLGGKLLSVKSYVDGKFNTYYDFNYDRETKRPVHAKKIKAGLDPVTLQNQVIFEEWSQYESRGDTITQIHIQEFPDGHVIKTYSDYFVPDHSILKMSVMRDDVLQEETIFTVPSDFFYGTMVQYNNPNYRTISTMVDDERIVYKLYNDGSAESIKIIRYNSHGDYISESTVTETTTVEYVYDSHGNWTRRVVHSPKGDTITEREITYYE